MNYQEWKHLNSEKYEQARRNFIIAANEYELEEALEYYYNIIKEEKLLVDDGK